MKLTRDDSYYSAYLDEMLSGPEMIAVSQHLQRTPEAQKELAGLQQTVAILRELPDPTPPPEFWDKTRQNLREFARRHKRRTSLRLVVRRLITGVWHNSVTEPREPSQPEAGPSIPPGGP